MTTCPICGINITEAVDVCPNCHARLTPPSGNNHIPPAKPGQAASKPGAGQRPDVNRPVRQPPPVQASKPTSPQVQQEKQQAPPGPEATATESSQTPGGPAGGPESGEPVKPEPAGAGYPGGAHPPGSPFGFPYGYYIPFPGGPYAGQGAGVEDTQAIALKQAPPPGYQMPFPLLPGWPYSPFMIFPAACYPYAMQQGMYPGYCYPPMGPQYPPAGSGYPPRAQAYDMSRRKKAGPLAVTLILLVILLLIAGAGVGIYLYLMPGNSSFDLGSSSVPGEDIELKNMRLEQKDGSAVLTGSYENQSSREGDVVVTITGITNGTDTILSFNVPVEAEKSESFSLSKASQNKLSSATLGPLLFKRSSTDYYDDEENDGGSYPWQDDGSDSGQDSDSSSTVPGSDVMIEEQNSNSVPYTVP